MSVEELREECNRVTNESNQRWKNLSDRLKKPTVHKNKIVYNSIAVKVYDLEKNLVAEFQSMKQAARFSGAQAHFVRKSVMRNIFIETKYGELRFEK